MIVRGGISWNKAASPQLALALGCAELWQMWNAEAEATAAAAAAA